MRDYTNNLEDKNIFIMSYKVKKNKIICTHPTGKKTIFEYSIEKEEEILDIMEKQVYNTNRYEDKLETKKRKNIENILVYLIIFSTNVALYLINKYEIYIDIFYILSIYSPILLAEAINTEKSLEDLKKSRYFLENKKTFDKNKTIKYKLQRKGKNNKFDINIIDKYSLRDLIKIKESIQKELIKDTNTELGFLYEEYDKTYKKK